MSGSERARAAQRRPSLPSATSRPSTSRSSRTAARSSRSTSRPGSRALYESANLARQALIDEGKGGERIHVYDRRSACGGAAFVAIAAARAAKAGASGAEALAAADRARERAQDVVRDRHARVPPQGRAHRCCSGLDGLSAPDQADPDARGGDHPGRARPHPPASVRAHGRVRPASATSPARRRGSSSTSTTTRRRATSSTNAARSSARTRSSSPRSARSSERTSAQASWEWAAWTRSFLG